LNSTTNEKFADLMAAAARKDLSSSAPEGGAGLDTLSSKKKTNLVTLLGRFQSQLRNDNNIMQILYQPLNFKCVHY
jgi:hypothetical protein